MLLLNSMGFILVVWHFKQQQRAARHCHWFHAIDNYAWYNICKSSSANCFEFMSPPLASKVCKFTIDFPTDCQFDKWLRNQNIEWQRENEWLTRDERKWYVMAGIRNWNSSPHFANPISPFALISNRFLSRNCLILFIKCSKYTMKTHLSTIQRVWNENTEKSRQHHPALMIVASSHVISYWHRHKKIRFLHLQIHGKRLWCC